MLKMYSYIILILCIIIFGVGLSGCVDNSEKQPHAIEEETGILAQFPAESNQVKSNDKQMIKDVYIEALQNKTKISCQNVDIYLNEYINNEYSDDGYTFQITRFTALDMDGDGIPEVVLEIFPGSERLVLHYDNGIVYGYDTGGPRCMGSLKKDGTYDWSGGVPHWGVSKLQFSSDIYETEILCEVDAPLYYINGEVVSEESFYSFYDTQYQKEDAKWYPFSEETISADFATIWGN